MRIFITGGTGFIGKFVLRKLDNGKNEILVLSRNLKPTNYSQKVSFLKGNIGRQKGWAKDLERFKPDTTIHMAWEGIPDFGVKTSRENLKNSLDLLKLLTKIGCRTIIATGTLWEYGERGGKLSEYMKPEPFNPFTEAKVSLYWEGSKITNKKGVNFIWVRLFYVYGPGQKSSSLIPYLISCAKTNKIPQMRNPNTQNDFIYVEDVAEAIQQILDKCKKSAVFNIGSGKVTGVQYIIRRIFSYFGVNEVYKKTKPRQTDNFAPAYADISKIRKVTGWKPKVTVEQGIRKVIKSSL